MAQILGILALVAFKPTGAFADVAGVRVQAGGTVGAGRQGAAGADAGFAQATDVGQVALAAPVVLASAAVDAWVDVFAKLKIVLGSNLLAVC